MLQMLGANLKIEILDASDDKRQVHILSRDLELTDIILVAIANRERPHLTLVSNGFNSGPRRAFEINAFCADICSVDTLLARDVRAKGNVALIVDPRILSEIELTASRRWISASRR